MTIEPETASPASLNDGTSDPDYRRLAELLPQIVVTVRRDGTVAYANAYALEFSGLSLDEGGGRQWIALIHPEDMPNINPRWRAAPGGLGGEGEVRLRDATGAYRWQLARVIPMVTDADGVSLWLVTASDIHDRKLAEGELVDREQRLNIALEIQKLGTWEVDLPSYTMRCNAQGKANFGRLPGEPFTYEDLFESIHPDDRVRIAGHMSRAITSREDYDAEYRAYWPDGSLHWILARGRAVYERGGTPTRMVGVTLDVTERKRAELALTDSERRYRTLAETSPLLVWTVRTGGEVDYFNQHWFDYTGRTPGTAYGHRWEEVVHPDDLAQFVSRRGETGLEPLILEGRLKRADGAYRWHLAQVVPLEVVDGVAQSWLGTAIDIDDRKRAELALEVSTARWRAVVETALDAMISIDAGGLITDWSPQAEAVFGYTEAEAVGQPMAELIIPLHWRERHAAGMARMMTTGEAPILGRRVEVEALHRDGHVFPIELSIAHHGAGDDARFSAFVRDITERRSAEDDLRLSEGRYRALTEALPALVVTTTPDGAISYISDAYSEYTGLTLEEAQDYERNQVIHPDDLEQSLAVWAEAIAAGTPMQNQMRLRRHDGIYRWFLVQANPVRGITDEIAYWMTVSVDIEERHRAEDRERLLQDTTAEMLASLDADSVLRQLARVVVPAIADLSTIGLFDESPHTTRIATVGVTREQAPHVGRIHIRRWKTEPGATRTIGEQIMAGEPAFMPELTPEWIDACAPEDQRVAAKELGARSVVCVPLIARGQAIGMGTFAYVGSGRRHTPQDLALLVEVVGRASIALDNARLFDNLRETAAHLERAVAAKDDFLSMVSHELRTPITTVMGNAEVLRRRMDTLDVETRALALDDIAREGERLSRIVDNLLTLARLERDQQVEMEPLLLQRAIERAAEAHRRDHPHRAIEAHCEGSPPPVLADETWIEQVLRNLLGNAEKYSPRDERIDIVCGHAGDEVTIRVLDRGAGIEDEDAAQIFTPFYRAERTAKTIPGAGIGLAVCKRLVEAMNGRIWAKPREGGGLEAGFSLPAATDE